jgi:putative effector of murein hydrolase LrgA (UPF0299 family)
MLRTFVPATSAAPRVPGSAVRAVRTGLAIAIGGYILTRMAHYPIAASFTGIILGLAMVALGAVRLRAMYGGTRRS